MMAHLISVTIMRSMTFVLIKKNLNMFYYLNTLFVGKIVKFIILIIKNIQFSNVKHTQIVVQLS